MATKTPLNYSMKSQDDFANLGSTAVEILLTKNKITSNLGNIINVEKNPKYQAMDVDLVVQVRQPDKKFKVSHIEIKGDTYPAGDISPALGLVDEGNFFFEIISNDTKTPRSPGCFMYTESDVVYYLYLTTGTLYQLNTNEVRDWFKQYISYDDNWLDTSTNLETLQTQIRGLKKTNTVTDDDKRVLYSTWGVTIPIKTVIEELEKKNAKVKKVDMLLEVLEAAARNGVVTKLMAKMPVEVKNRAHDLWAHHHSSDAPLDYITKKTKIEISYNV